MNRTIMPYLASLMPCQSSVCVAYFYHFSAIPVGFRFAISKTHWNRAEMVKIRHTNTDKNLGYFSAALAQFLFSAAQNITTTRDYPPVKRHSRSNSIIRQYNFQRNQISISSDLKL